MFLGITGSSAQLITPQWAFQIGGLGADRGVKLITDPTGNIYFTGIIEKEVYLSNNGVIDTVTSYGQEDIYFGKLNPEGQLLWSKHFGGKGVDNPTDVMINGEGDVYLSGIFEDTLYIESDTLISQDYIDSFVAKYDSLGNLNWLRQLSGVGNQQCLSLVNDLQGNLLSGGFFTKTIEFLGTNSENWLSQGGYDGFLAKWTPQGDLTWVKLIQGTGKTIIKDVLMDNFNDYYVIGDFTDSLTTDSSQNTVYSYGKSDAFIAKYANNGDFSWIKTVGGVHDDKAKCITFGGNGKMIMTGEFKDKLFHMNKKILNGEGGDDIFHLTFKKNGKLNHDKKHGLEKNDFVFDAWIPVGQKILMTSDLKIEEGNQNVTLASYGMLGDISEIFQTGIDFNPIIQSVVMPELSNLIFCGSFHGTVIFDQISLISQGDKDFFILKMAPEIDSADSFQPDSLKTQSVFSQLEYLKLNEMENQPQDSLLTSEELTNFFNYPNPFMKKTKIIYSLPETCEVIIKILDINGACIKNWEYSNQPLGNYFLDFNAEVYRSGIYHCQLLAKGDSVFISKVIKMIHVN